LIHVDFVESELAEVLRQTGIDLSVLPPVITAAQLAPVLGNTPSALAQTRYRRDNHLIPYVKYGRLVRYLRADVARYLVTHRTGGDDVG
jgi:hypothetical protein